MHRVDRSEWSLVQAPRLHVRDRTPRPSYYTL